MFTRFYTDTIITKFIKHLVASTELPTIQVWKPGDPVYAGLSYITKTSVLKCIKNGLPVNEDSECFKYQFPYIFGQKYTGLTSTYTSNIKGYDSNTHYQLGQYLRAIRDIKGIDLMPFYNCFNGEYARGISILKNNDIDYKEDKDYNILCIPVKYNQEYTIGLESDVPIQYGYIFYSNIGFEEKVTRDYCEIFYEHNHLNTPHLIAPGLKNNWRMQHPHIIKTPTVIEDVTPVVGAIPYAQYEKYFKLVIKLPKTVETSIAVLEGNFEEASKKYFRKNEVGTTLPKPEIITSDNKVENFIGSETKEYLTDVSNLSLLQINDKNIYAFSNRLIEYLLLNVITPDETIRGNIERIQYYAQSSTNVKENNTKAYVLDSFKGVWNESLRKYLFKLALDSKYLESKLDINGYVDKDIEQIITRGQTPKWLEELIW